MAGDHDDLDQLYRETREAVTESTHLRWREVVEADPQRVAAWASGVAIEPGCVLDVVYDAMSDLEPMPDAFFEGELSRLLDEVERDPSKLPAYEQLEFFWSLAAEGSLRSRIRARLQAALESPTPQLRRVAAYLIADSMDGSISDVHVTLQRLVREDPDWRVRVLAHRTLEDHAIDHPPTEPLPGLRFSDRFRSSIRAEPKTFAA